ncbi:MAG: helix-turn-helix transcriptional regulator, partial [Alphaproteobacteria bacterium]
MIIDEIRKARESKGLSRRALAEMLDVDPQAIVRLEAGTGSIDLLIRVMDAVDFHFAGLAPGRS